MFVKPSAPAETAFRACEAIAFRHYENFPVASLLIPREKRKYVAAIYAFARTADDYADEEGYSTRTRIENLSRLHQELRRCENGGSSTPLFLALGQTIREFGLSLRPFEDLLTAFKMDVEKNRYETWKELLHYCSCSANPIGRVMLKLFGYDDENELHASDAICTALQLTNFWQDLPIDARRGRLYLPLEDLRKFDCTERDILELRNSESLRKLIAFEVGRTKALFEEGKPLLDAVGKDLRLQLKFTWFGGMKILEKIKRRNYETFTQRPVITFWDKLTIGSRVIGFSSQSSL